MKSILALPLALAVLSTAASAQESLLSAAFDAARAPAAVAPTPAATQAAPESCSEAKELETSFEFTHKPADGSAPLDLTFSYVSCEWTPRNDYLPPYEERSYKSKDGYVLTIVTDEGSATSEVLLSKSGKWIGRLGSPANAALASGKPVTLTAESMEGANKTVGTATLRNAAKPAGVASLSCRPTAARTRGGFVGILDLRTMILASARGVKSPLLDASQGAKLIDDRCGKTAAAIETSDNFEVTAPHIWGQDILQLPKDSLPASGTASFSANLHTCSYDGGWSASDDVALTCVAAIK